MIPPSRIDSVTDRLSDEESRLKKQQQQTETSVRFKVLGELY